MTPPSNKQTRKAAETTARERAAALKAQAAREERRRRLMARGGLALIVVAVVGGIVAIGLAQSGSKSEKLTGNLPSIVASDPKAEAAKNPPPWPAPTDVASRANLAGLSVLPNEMLARHDHVHLDIWADGNKVSVPAYIGIAGGATPSGLTSLHTHDDSGLIHIESPAGERHTLGQVFIEWNVYLSADQVGGLKAANGKTFTVYLNGKKFAGDPSTIELKAHQEIAMVYGTAAENAKVKVPAKYDFPANT